MPTEEEERKAKAERAKKLVRPLLPTFLPAKPGRAVRRMTGLLPDRWTSFTPLIHLHSLRRVDKQHASPHRAQLTTTARKA